METLVHIISMVLVGYFMGSIPFAKLFTLRTGVNLFETGTGNPGAANVFRKINKKTGVAVFIADVLKGAVPVLLASLMGVTEGLWFISGWAAVLGHWYPIFNRFKGGAGLACGVGVVLSLMPVGGIIGVAAGAIVLAKVKSSGHAALVGLIMIIISTALINSKWPLGAELPAIATAPALALILFAKATTRGWKPGRKD
ncbi:MAG: hypothetical protein FI699_04350 [SAR202 cluster bacterium]|nr:hypothetical protein [Chloroflexota bacterium]MQG88084.1 hypothetical protein [SAR202 cluster bacterium]|tara:strand:+ start:586 stop:1179 length:594 start_codon:yes stop_codon:yes gene_type:complete